MKISRDPVEEILSYFWPLNHLWAGWKKLMSKRVKKETSTLLDNVKSRLEQELKQARKSGYETRAADLEGVLETLKLLKREYGLVAPEGDDEPVLIRSGKKKKTEQHIGFVSPPAKPRWNRQDNDNMDEAPSYTGSGDSYVARDSYKHYPTSYRGNGKSYKWTSWAKPLPQAEADDLPIPEQFAAILPSPSVESAVDTCDNSDTEKTAVSEVSANTTNSISDSVEASK